LVGGRSVAGGLVHAKPRSREVKRKGCWAMGVFSSTSTSTVRQGGLSTSTRCGLCDGYVFEFFVLVLVLDVSSNRREFRCRQLFGVGAIIWTVDGQLRAVWPHAKPRSREGKRKVWWAMVVFRVRGAAFVMGMFLRFCVFRARARISPTPSPVRPVATW
jgi:hypothetical protein